MEPNNNNRRETNINDFSPEKKSSTGKKVLIYAGVGLGVIAISYGVYYFFLRDTGNKKDFTAPPEEKPKTTTNTGSGSGYTTPKNTGSSPGYTPPKAPSGFPLKKGSRGPLVKHLQEALIKSYGKSILPKWGADSDFGSETEKALLAKGLPKVLDETAFNKIVSPATTDPTKPANTPATPTVKATLTNDQAIKVASELITAIKAEDAMAIARALAKIQNVEDYKLANEPFKTFALDGKPQTIVNGILGLYDDDDTEKITFKSRFLQIGLKFSAQTNTWSLSGLPAPRIITLCDTLIRNKKGFCLEVPAKTIIGHEKCSAAGITSFTTLDGQELTVPSKHVRYV